MLDKPWHQGSAAAFLISCAILPEQMASAEPAGLTVAPVHLALADARRSVSTVVTNPGSTPITVQVRLYSWTMRGEEEVYGPASDVGYSPPLFRLDPHATQAVRIVAKVPPGPTERSYRLIIDQLPLEAAPGQLQLPVRMALPVFVEPRPGTSRTSHLEWTARYDSIGSHIVVAVANRGTVHVRIINLTVDDAQGTVGAAHGLAGYALAGQTRNWSYRADQVPASVTITAEDGATPIRVTVPVSRG